MSNNPEQKQKKRITSKYILLASLVVVLYLIGRATVFSDFISSSLAVGIIIGIGIGSYYTQLKIKETQQQIRSS